MTRVFFDLFPQVHSKFWSKTSPQVVLLGILLCSSVGTHKVEGQPTKGGVSPKPSVSNAPKVSPQTPAANLPPQSSSNSSSKGSSGAGGSSPNSKPSSTKKALPSPKETTSSAPQDGTSSTSVAPTASGEPSASSAPATNRSETTKGNSQTNSFGASDSKYSTNGQEAAEDLKSKATLGLHPLLLPTNDEFSCHWGYSCYLGLPGGFAFGGDFLGTAHALNVKTIQIPGKWVLWDFKIAWEMPFSTETSSAYVALGHKVLVHEDSQYRKLSRAGFTLGLGSVLDLGSNSSIGILNDLWLGETITNIEKSAHVDNAEGNAARILFYRYYTYLRDHPYFQSRILFDQHLFYFALPALGLSAPIHFFLPVTAYFKVIKQIHAEIAEITETDIGGNAQLQIAYSSDTEESGRSGFYIGYGMDFGVSIVKAKQKGLSNVPNGREPVEIRPNKKARQQFFGSFGFTKEL